MGGTPFGGTFPDGGTWEPQEPLSGLNGCDANGVWTLTFSAPGLGIGIGTLFVALLGIYVSQRMLPNAQQIADLQIKQQTLLANIQALEQRGGSASLAYCHGPSRKQELCILVDANTKTNLPGYRIIVTK